MVDNKTNQLGGNKTCEFSFEMLTIKTVAIRSVNISTMFCVHLIRCVEHDSDVIR